MEKDQEFEKLLHSYTETFNPYLIVILQDEKLLWTYEEMERTQGLVPPSLRIFKMGTLLPMSMLYSIRRKDMLTDAKIVLPFWYSIPIISAIAALLSRLKKKKKKKQQVEQLEIEETYDARAKIVNELRNIAESIKTELVPVNHTLETYMDELESRWNRLIDTNSRYNFTIDVQSLVRDNLRMMIKVHKSINISREGIREAAIRIISSTSTLGNLNNIEALRLYIELFMVKMLENIK
jgi:hypothetical protein